MDGARSGGVQDSDAMEEKFGVSGALRMWQMAKNGRRTIAAGLSLLAAGLVVALALLPVQLAEAQDVTPDMLRNLRGGATGNQATIPTAPTIQTFQPVPPQIAAPPSRLEDLYSTRAGRRLQQIGYDALGVPSAVTIVESGAIQESYILGVGDELVFELRGQENSSYRQRVDRSGNVVLPKLNPIPAAGYSLGQFRAALESAVSKAYVSTNIFVSLGEIHQVSILVTGNVRTPGLRILSGLASPMDAILLSGGISKLGSLRNVQLIRGGTARIIDLYGIILKGGTANIGMLQDGDRIYVAPLGATVAIAGNVRRPGIYELPVGSPAITTKALVALAGGTLIANAYDLSKTSLDRDGTTRLVPTTMGGGVRSGEIVFVDPSRSADVDRVTLGGAIALPSTRPLSATRTTGDLFHSFGDLDPMAYTPFAVIARRSARSNSISLIPFSVIRALSKAQTTALQSGDNVYVFTLEELRALTRIATKDVNTPYQPTTPGMPAAPGGTATPGGTVTPDGTVTPGGTGTPADTGTLTTPNGAIGGLTSGDAGAPLVGGTTAPGGARSTTGFLDPRDRAVLNNTSSETAALAEARALIRAESGGGPRPFVPTETDTQIIVRISGTLGVPPEMLQHTVADHLVWVLDQVQVPGVYAAADGTTVPEIIEAAGGPLAQADLSAIEVTSTDFDRLAGVSHTTRNTYAEASPAFGNVLVQALDVIRLRQVYADRTGETVTVAGQVRYPGVFDITRDERLSSVLQRAGGVTEVAYPYGAIFTRRSAAIHEQEGNDRSARELQGQLAIVAASPATTTSGPGSGVAFLADLVEQVRDAPALGRVTVTADPVVLASRPDLDVILEPGDAVYIPKRPSSVTVSGEVLNPGSFQFRTDLGYEDYIRLAGGPSQSAYESKAFIVMPDGSAIPTEDSWLSYGSSGHIPPGSTIIVPRDLRPFDWGQFLKDATQIVSQLAVAAASLAVIRNN